jgi:hypothetical protein
MCVLSSSRPISSQPLPCFRAASAASQPSPLAVCAVPILFGGWPLQQLKRRVCRRLLISCPVSFLFRARPRVQHEILAGSRSSQQTFSAVSSSRILLVDCVDLCNPLTILCTSYQFCSRCVIDGCPCRWCVSSACANGGCLLCPCQCVLRLCLLRIARGSCFAPGPPCSRSLFRCVSLDSLARVLERKRCKSG